MTHPQEPLLNDDSWSTGDEGFDLRIKLSLEQRDAALAELAAESELVAALQAELSRVTEAAARQVAEAREEQREACARVALDPTKWDADDVSAGYPEDVARDIRATPLGATPLADENAELKVNTEMAYRAGEVMLAERDAKLAALFRERDGLLARVGELCAERDALKALCSEHYAKGTP